MYSEKKNIYISILFIKLDPDESIFEKVCNVSICTLHTREKNYVKALFTSEAYVKNEFHYHSVTKKHNFDETVLSNWTSYLGEGVHINTVSTI